jgi:hypothetical protein
MEFKKPSEEEWDEIVNASPDSWLNSLSGWMAFFRDCFHYKDVSFGVYDPELVCVVPLFVVKNMIFGTRLVSGPVLDNGGFISAVKLSEEKVGRITEHIVDVARSEKCCFVEIRNSHQAPIGFEKVSKYVDFKISLSKDDSALLASFDKKLRNGIRKAEKLVRVERCSISGGIDDFYRMHLKTMQFLSSPPMPESFYSRMNGFMLFAVHNGKRIAAVMVNCFRDDAKYEAAVYLPEFREFQPNSLLVYRALSEARKDGMKTFFFGRTLPEGSVYDFKKRWNAVEIPIDYYYKVFKGKIPSDARKSALAKFAFVWRLSPVFLTRVFGPYFRRRLAM